MNLFFPKDIVDIIVSYIPTQIEIEYDTIKTKYNKHIKTVTKINNDICTIYSVKHDVFYDYIL